MSKVYKQETFKGEQKIQYKKTPANDKYLKFQIFVINRCLLEEYS